MAAGGANLDRFFQAVEEVKDELKELLGLCTNLRRAIASARSLRGAADLRELRARVVIDASAALVKAKLVRVRLESLDRVFAGTAPYDGNRASVAERIRGKIGEAAETFAELQGFVEEEHRVAVGKRFREATGVAPDVATLDALVSSGEARRLLREAVEGSSEGDEEEGAVVEAEEEIRERHGVSRVMCRSLVEVQRVLTDSKPPATRALQPQYWAGDVEKGVARADPSVRLGMLLLQDDGHKGKRNRLRRWIWYGLLALCTIIIAVAVVFVLYKLRRRP